MLLTLLNSHLASQSILLREGNALKTKRIQLNLLKPTENPHFLIVLQHATLWTFRKTFRLCIWHSHILPHILDRCEKNRNIHILDETEGKCHFYFQYIKNDITTNFKTGL